MNKLIKAEQQTIKNKLEELCDTYRKEYGINSSTKDTAIIDDIINGELKLFTNGIEKRLVSKIYSIAPCVDSLADKIAECNGDKNKLEAMAIYLFNIDLNKRSSFENMVKELESSLQESSSQSGASPE